MASHAPIRCRVSGGLKAQPAVAICLLLLFCSLSAPRAAEFFTLKGHGGPVMDVATAPLSGRIATASFDNSVGLWEGTTPRWLEGHDAAVNAVIFVTERLLASAGDDFTIFLWDLDKGSRRRLTGHKGKIRNLAVSPDASLLASASWDGTIGIWPVGGGEPRFLRGHGAAVNDVLFSRDGSRLYSASADGTIRIWRLASHSLERRLLGHGFGVNAMALSPDESWLAYGAVDGVTRVVDPASGDQIADFTLDRRPILVLALSPDGSRLSVGDGLGYITIVDTSDWAIVNDFRAALTGPVWALAFSPDAASINAGGIDNIVYSWPLDDLDDFAPMAQQPPGFLNDPASMSNGERQFMRKCSICHTLSGEGRRKAGPPLDGLFGRPAGSLPDYPYSPVLRQAGIVWSDQTIDRLFDLGPDHYIPGSKMPMQRIAGHQDRRDLIDFLRRATARPPTTSGELQ